MPKAFLISLLWALSFHGGLLGLLLFAWPYFGQSIFSFDRFQICEVSLVERPKPVSFLSQRKVQKMISRGRPVQTEKEMTDQRTETPDISSIKTLVMEELSGIPEAEKGVTAGAALSFQRDRRGSPSEGHGRGGHGLPAGDGKESESSSSPPAVTVPTSDLAVPRYGLNRKPYYPAMARERGWQGTVLLKVLISKNGAVETIELECSSGFSILDRSAIKGVKEWKFNPGRKDGQPVEMWVRIPVTFRLE
jgi:TonB family protein